MITPMFCMFLLTFAVGLCAFYARVAGVKQGKISPRYFLLMREDENCPELIQKTTRNFNNQFEIPVLFYVVCTLFLVLKIENVLAISLAWCFVASRILHAIIHISYNHLLHRVVVYWLGVFLVVALWVMLFVKGSVI